MRLIDADAIGEPYKIVINNRCVVDQSVYLAKDINNAKTIDAVPVVHGKWLCSETFSSSILFRNSEMMMSECCSACGHYNTRMARVTKTKFCPNCGAKMDEV